MVAEFDALLIAGPTASGKSGLALRLAELMPAELISVDSAQVYRGFDIGSAKPSRSLRDRIPHHLIDIRNPEDTYSAGEFVTDALQAIETIRARGRLPILVGGTMLYFNALIRGIARLPTADPDIRRAIDADAAVRGWPAVHTELLAVDPMAAAKIHPNDAQRIQRALEVYRATGRPISEWQRETSARHTWRFSRLALVPTDRAWLHERIEQRFRQMMQEGFLEEVRALRARSSLAPETPSLRAVGYRQLWAHLVGEIDLPTAVARAVVATRQLAKRQLTWIHADPDWEGLDPQREDLIEAKVAALQRGLLSQR
ncbi:MAG: tRNA (adenosine(37)-N6)-dimethylallyltransferase MiaA [Acidibacter sp.]|nr:tRNA (adenosine(37)-N6)-dimethylallyltransferase MiaA [Acidibacter sp.]